MIEAQYYSDGILVGAPVINRTWGHAVAVWNYSSANLQAGRKLSNARLSLLNKTAVSACGEKATVCRSIPFISDPMACKFDPAALACHVADSGAPTYYGWLPRSEGNARTGWGFNETGVNNEPAFDLAWVGSLLVSLAASPYVAVGGE